MKKVSITVFLVLSCLSLLHAEDIQLGDTKDLHNKRFTWSIPADRIDKLPVWKKGEAVPLSVSRAEDIAHEWSRRQDLAGRPLPERPHVIVLTQFPAPFDSFYYYKVHFADTNNSDSFWTVHILMDGTVVEPQGVQAEQDGTGLPAPRPESNSEGGDKTQPEAEVRSR